MLPTAVLCLQHYTFPYLGYINCLSCSQTVSTTFLLLPCPFLSELWCACGTWQFWLHCVTPVVLYPKGAIFLLAMVSHVICSCATGIGSLHGWNFAIERRCWVQARSLVLFLLSPFPSELWSPYVQQVSVCYIQCCIWKFLQEGGVG